MFERLTRWENNDKDVADLIEEKSDFDGLTDAINRLAEYEDSGLSPEEVQELAKAKADGRLVVLPCKVGDNCAFGDANITETIKHWRPERVCLCGSTRFFRAFDDWNFRFTLEGKIVLTIGCNTKSDKGLGLTDEDKIKLDELHKRKIDLADWIFVIDVGGYIGSSTQSEIEYAQLHGKPIKYLSKEFPDYQEPADYHNPADVAEIEQLRAQVARMREALEKAREALDYWRELYGIGLEVLNWHMNGNTEPFDSFYDNSGTYEALAEIDKAIYALRKGMLLDEARTIEIMRGGREK